MEKIGYARVSSEDQNLARQIEALKTAGVAEKRIYTDKCSGKDRNRPEFEAMMRFLREGDELYVMSMDRLSRSLKDLLDVATTLRDAGVSIHFLKERIDLIPNETVSPMTGFMFSMLGAVAQFERELIKERQREGIAIAKAKGVYKGRTPVTKEKLDEAQRLLDMKVPLAQVARDLKVSRSSLYRYLKN